ncbi:hypothetical protein [Clostridium estertheticum]|uniref:hypothetical protein n=1 Tax=Clostridium estertheticum TaxID=238834 RepID=UPI001C0D23C5|nr:hypothetical protein [Clostridium estertheticum]MBU3186893.1 hypothetical protein [Clostridium estertheticum]
MADRLNPGEKLLPGEQLLSANEKYSLVMQGDGNLVLYTVESMDAAWSSETHGHQVDWAVLQEDGNFVIYGEGRALWHTHTHGNPVAHLVLQDDRNVVIYGPEWKALWHTHTNIRPLRFPISAEQEDGLGNDRKMRTKFTVSNTGRINALTKTRTKDKLEGFHGTVILLLTDQEGNILYESKPHTYGVNGTLVPGSPSKREEHWSEEFPQEIVEKIGGYVVLHFVDPNSTIMATLEKFNKILDELVDANRKIKEIYTSWQSETALVP